MTNLFSTMKLRPKMIAGFVAVLLICTVVAGVGYVTQTKRNETIGKR